MIISGGEELGMAHLQTTADLLLMHLEGVTVLHVKLRTHEARQ